MPVVSKKVKERISQEVYKAFGGNLYEIIIGGAALSIKEVTGKPIRFIGEGEQVCFVQLYVAAPVILIGLQHHLHAHVPFGQLVSAGADGGLEVFFVLAGLQGQHAAAGQQGGNVQVGGGGFDQDGIAVRGGFRRPGFAPLLVHLILGIQGGHIVDGIGAGFGGQVFTVGEFDALADIEAPGIVVHLLPGGGNTGAQGGIGVQLHQGIQDRISDAVRGVVAGETVQSCDVAGQADAKAVFLGDGDAAETKHQGQGQKQSDDAGDGLHGISSFDCGVFGVVCVECKTYYILCKIYYY